MNKLSHVKISFVALAVLIGWPLRSWAADPTARGTFPNVVVPGATSYTIVVRYLDDECLQALTTDDNDIRVTGPNGFDVPARLVSRADETVEFGVALLVTYAIVPPGGSWDSSDNGIYRVNMQPRQVFDCIGGAVQARVLGSFNVDVTAGGTPPAAQPTAISTRLRVLTGDNVMIGGFIIRGNAPKKVVMRAIGPSLAAFGLTGLLVDPVITLVGPGGPIASNDNWKDAQQTAIQATNLAPSDDRESAIVATLPPGAYTAIMEGARQSTGIGLLQIYDFDTAADSKLASISTRGFVDSADNIMIGGFSLGGGTGTTAIGIRGLGPTLSQYNVPGVLADPVLDLRNANGDLIRSNNDWRETQQAEIERNNLAPSNASEAVIIASLPPGDYTALLKGNNGATGVALVEIFHLP